MEDRKLSDQAGESVDQGWKLSETSFWRWLAIITLIIVVQFIYSVKLALDGDHEFVGWAFVKLWVFWAIFCILVVWVKRKMPGLFVVVGLLLGLTLFGSSFLLNVGPGGETVGITIRMAGLITIAQSCAFWSIIRRQQRSNILI